MQAQASPSFCLGSCAYCLVIDGIGLLSNCRKRCQINRKRYLFLIFRITDVNSVDAIQQKIERIQYPGEKIIQRPSSDEYTTTNITNNSVDAIKIHCKKIFDKKVTISFSSGVTDGKTNRIAVPFAGCVLLMLTKYILTLTKLALLSYFIKELQMQLMIVPFLDFIRITE